MDPKEIYDKEGEGMMKQINQGRQENISDYQTEMIVKAVETGIKKALKGFKLEIPATQKVEGNVGILNKIVAQIEKWPVVQKVSGTITAIVQFPQLQNVLIKNQVLKTEVINKNPQKVEIVNPQTSVGIEGPVTAEVVFPKVQDVQVLNEVKTNLPVLDMENFRAVPMIFTDGKKLISPFSQQVQSNGRIVAAIEELKSATATQSVFYSGQARITISGTLVTLPPGNIKTAVIQALRDNRDVVYISAAGGMDYELQPGQPVTVVIDRLNKVVINGSYVNDGVCYIAS